MASDIDFDHSEAVKILTALDNLSGDVQQGRQYIDRYLSLSNADEGIINSLTGAHDSVKTKVEENLQDIRTYLDTTLTDNLKDTFDLYNSNESGVQSKLDTLEEFFQAEANGVEDRRETASEDLGQEPATGSDGRPFPAPEYPVDHYTPVEVGNDGVSEVTEPPGVLDYFSFTYYARMITEMIVGDDPLDIVGARIAGDWNQFILIAKALRNLADGMQATQTNLCAHVDQLEQVWDGNAYMACNYAIYGAASEIRDGTVQPLRDAADVYEEAADAAYKTYQDLAPILNSIIDAATGIGLVKAVLGAASKAASRQVGELVDDAAARISEFQGMISTLRSDLDSVSTDFQKLKPVGSVPQVMAEYEKL